MAKKSMSVAAIKSREYRKKLKEPGNEAKYALYKQKDKERNRKWREKQNLINQEAVSTNKKPTKSKKTIVKEPFKRPQAKQPDLKKNTKRTQSKLSKHPVEPVKKKPAKSKATNVQNNAKQTQVSQHPVKTEFPKNNILSIQENVKFLQSKLPKEPREAFEVVKSLGKSLNLHFYTVQTVQIVKQECQ